MTTSEEAPLLPDREPHLSETTSKHELVYERFSPRRKRVLLTIVSLYAVLPREWCFWLDRALVVSVKLNPPEL